MQARHIKIIQLLLNNQSEFISATEIANYVNVSNRTARNDIKLINANNSTPNLITSYKSRGFKLNFDNYTLAEIENIVAHLSTYQDKVVITIGYHLLIDKKSHTIKEIMRVHQLSKTEVSEIINQIQAWSASFNLQITVHKRNGIRVRGSETQIRNALLHLDQLIEGHQGVEQLILNELPHAHRQTIATIIERTLNDHHIATSQAQLQQLLIHFIIIYKRRDYSTDDITTNQQSLNIAKTCMTRINDALGYQINETTAKLFSFFISHHFNQFSLSLQRELVKSFIDTLIEKMEQQTNFSFSNDHLFKENILTHFSKMYYRIINHVYVNNPLTTRIKTQYPYMFNTLYEVLTLLQKSINLTLNEDEIAFLTVHFQAAYDREHQKQRPIRTLIACYYGIGISNLLETKITQDYPQIKVIDTITLEQITHYDFTNIDLLITTHQPDQIDTNRTQILQVSPLLDTTDQEKLDKAIKKATRTQKSQQSPGSINPHIISQEITSMQEVFDTAANSLHTAEPDSKIIDTYIKNAYTREQSSSTYIGNGIAIPHGNPKALNHSQILVFTSQRGIHWRHHKAHLIFFLAIADKDAHETKHIMQSIARLTEADVTELLQLDHEQLKSQLNTLFYE